MIDHGSSPGRVVTTIAQAERTLARLLASAREDNSSSGNGPRLLPTQLRGEEMGGAQPVLPPLTDTRPAPAGSLRCGRSGTAVKSRVWHQVFSLEWRHEHA